MIADDDLRLAKNLVAKEDLASLEDKVKIMEISLHQEMLRMEGSLRLEMSRLETKIADTKSELLRWMFVFWVGQVAATLAIVFSALKLVK